jgi:hypothetical protein
MNVPVVDVSGFRVMALVPTSGLIRPQLRGAPDWISYTPTPPTRVAYEYLD